MVKLKVIHILSIFFVVLFVLSGCAWGFPLRLYLSGNTFRMPQWFTPDEYGVKSGIFRIHLYTKRHGVNQRSSYGPYVCVEWIKVLGIPVACKKRVRKVIEYYDDFLDTGKVYLDGLFYLNYSTPYYSFGPQFLGRKRDKTESILGGVASCTYYSDHYKYQTGYAGSYVHQMYLKHNTLESLTNDSMVTLSVIGAQGDFPIIMRNDTWLDLVIAKKPSPPKPPQKQDVSPVPEPSSLSLVCLALICMLILKSWGLWL